MKYTEWEGFVGGEWEYEINVRDFIQKKYTPYLGDSSFLEGPTKKTDELWNEVLELYKKEKKNGGVLEVSADVASTILAHNPGYIDKDKEQIVGLQTDKPLKRAIMPNGGIKIVEKSCEAAGVELNPEIKKIFTEYRTTHNDGVFRAYTEEIRKARSSHLITGLPDRIW